MGTSGDRDQVRSFAPTFSANIHGVLSGFDFKGTGQGKIDQSNRQLSRVLVNCHAMGSRGCTAREDGSRRNMPIFGHIWMF